MPGWYVAALANRQSASACVAFAEDFLKASHAERDEVVNSWDPTLKWALPNPWRLACADEAGGASEDRIRTALLFQALGFSDVDTRESIMGFAVVHNSSKLAGIDPRPIFLAIADAVGGAASRALRDFASRDPEDQSMEAFGVKAVADACGGYEMKPDW